MKNCLLPTVIFTSLFILSCGYSFVGLSPINLPQEQSDLYISFVHNPTQEAWLEPYIRSKFRDEFTRRGGARWVSEDQAQTYIHIDIKQLRTSDGVTSQRDKTVKTDVSITVEVKMLSAETGELLWSSGNVTGRSSFFLAVEDSAFPGTTGPAQRRASEDAVDQALTRVADRLGDGF